MPIFRKSSTRVDFAQAAERAARLFEPGRPKALAACALASHEM
jgi:hypothetical protein